MHEGRQVRLIRKAEAGADTKGSGEVTPDTGSATSEREIKTVVSRWVREHRQQSEEFRLAFTSLLKGGGFHLPSR